MTSDTRPALLIALFVLQAVCALFFLGDVAFDLAETEAAATKPESDVLEYAVTVALVIGLVFSGIEMNRLLTRHKRMSNQLKAASGAFAELLEEHFDTWGLTTSERDVALLAIKGLSIADMARLRETREGTIKAQCNAIYRKADVSGRPQLLSLFIEELMADGLTSPAAN